VTENQQIDYQIETVSSFIKDFRKIPLASNVYEQIDCTIFCSKDGVGRFQILPRQYASEEVATYYDKYSCLQTCFATTGNPKRAAENI
jgi:hypothetical protein